MASTIAPSISGSSGFRHPPVGSEPNQQEAKWQPMKRNGEFWFWSSIQDPKTFPDKCAPIEHFRCRGGIVRNRTSGCFLFHVVFDGPERQGKHEARFGVDPTATGGIVSYRRCLDWSRSEPVRLHTRRTVVRGHRPVRGDVSALRGSEHLPGRRRKPRIESNRVTAPCLIKRSPIGPQG